MRPLGSPQQLEQRRIKAIALLTQGLRPVDVAKQLGVDRRSVRRWKSSFRKTGKEALKAIPSLGRPHKLAARSKMKLEQILLSGAKNAGYPSDLWTCPRVTNIIYRTFKIRYHSAHVSRILHAMGWSPQKPERRAKERNEKAIANWIRYQWPQIKKKPTN